MSKIEEEASKELLIGVLLPIFLILLVAAIFALVFLGLPDLMNWMIR